jgi:hypothetical protein
LEGYENINDYLSATPEYIIQTKTTKVFPKKNNFLNWLFSHISGSFVHLG